MSGPSRGLNPEPLYETCSNLAGHQALPIPPLVRRGKHFTWPVYWTVSSAEAETKQAGMVPALASRCGAEPLVLLQATGGHLGYANMAFSNRATVRAAAA